MGENEESFRDKLVKMAQSVEIIESVFNNGSNIKINIDLNENDYNYISKNLNTNQKDEKSIISIGRVDFIFLKK